MSAPSRRIVRAAEIAAAAQTFSHPLNPNSEISGAQLAPRTGLTRLGVSIARVPPGKESFIYHRHHGEEEWVYVLEGEGESDIEDVVERVGPGDFLGYPAGVAHTLRNIGTRDLVYLMGGEQLAMELAEFPREGKRVLRVGGRTDIVDDAACEQFWPPKKDAP
jgi:uncharacterized cupin superfamily protein